MRVLNVSEHDWANFAYDNTMSLRAVGVESHSLILEKHPFQYTDTSRIVTKSQMQIAIKSADVIQAFHSPKNLIPLLKGCGKPVIVYHTGTGYRQAPLAMHNLFKGIATSTVCALPELYLQAEKLRANPVYIVGGIAIPNKVSFATPARVRIAHHPSNAKVKGTEVLRPLLNRYRAQITTDRIPYARQLERLEKCDVYVEMMATSQGSAEYGSFGITALEAAARGKIVLTNCVKAGVYRSHYGEEPFIFCNDLASLKHQLDLLYNTKPANVIEFKRHLHERFTQLHSHTATGKYILDNVLSTIL